MWKKNLFFLLLPLFIGYALPAWAHRDPLVQLLIKKGVITEEEIARVEKK